MTEADIIIIGAGAAGLMAAMELIKKGKKLIVLEARDRLGGRIHTLEDIESAGPVEAGAEFIHGHLPVTLGLLKEAGIGWHAIKGEIWQYSQGELSREGENNGDGKLLTTRLRELKEDISVASFLDKYFAEEKHAELVASVKGYVEGYDAADIHKAGAYALRDDWPDGGDWEEQYRVNGGYGKLIKFLEDQCNSANCAFHTSVIVKEIRWRPGHIEIFSDSHDSYIAKKVVISVPLGVLQLTPPDKGAIIFLPSVPDKSLAAKSMGFGNVIKILLQFNEAFWKEKVIEKRLGNSMENLGWLFSDAPIPTWWTQLPQNSSLLTGWLAGPRARQWKETDENSILNQALHSLTVIFRMSMEKLTERLAFSRIINWTVDPFARGAYAYSTIETTEAIKLMSLPVDQTLFFAGEALHDGPHMGTVEGALASGKRAAKQVLQNE